MEPSVIHGNALAMDFTFHKDDRRDAQSHGFYEVLTFQMLGRRSSCLLKGPSLLAAVVSTAVVPAVVSAIVVIVT